MDEVFVRELEVTCIIGVHDWERCSRQRLLVSVELAFGIRDSSAADELAATIDYARVCDDVLRIAATEQFRLLESFAERVAGRLLADYGPSRVTVEVSKPAALRLARAAGVRITRPSRAPL